MTEEQFRSGEGVEHGFDYMAAADKTCSVLFKPEQVSAVLFIRCLRDVIEASQKMDKFKKLLFRGKTPAEVGLNMPSHGMSLADAFSNSDATINIVHGIVGAITEVGEAGEILYAHVINETPFDEVNIAEEAGDLGWYIVRMLRGVGITRDQCDRMNINKLTGRHGASFDQHRDANRDLEVERAKLEGDFDPRADAETGEDIASIAGRYLDATHDELAPMALTDVAADCRRMAASLLRQRGPNVGKVDPVPAAGVRDR